MCACSCLAVASLHTLHPPKPPSRLAPHFQVQLEAGPPSEEHPRLFSVVIHYSQRFITKVHPKTCRNRMLSHCEGATPGTPISTNAFSLCNKNVVPTDRSPLGSPHPTSPSPPHARPMLPTRVRPSDFHISHSLTAAGISVTEL